MWGSTILVGCGWCGRTCNCTTSFTFSVSSTASTGYGCWGVRDSTPVTDWNAVFKPAKNWRWFDRFREVAAIVAPPVIAVYEATRRCLQAGNQTERRRHKRKRFLQSLSTA